MVGGIGLIVMAIAILPFLHVGGMRLFQTESSDKSDKFAARSASVAKSISIVYVGITSVCATAYFLAGMDAFDAVTHAMTTLATGGYANYDSSFGGFNGTIQWLAVVFMLAGGLPFVLYIRMLRGDRNAVVTNSQVRVLILFLLVVILSLTLWRWQSAPAPALEALRRRHHRAGRQFLDIARCRQVAAVLRHADGRLEILTVLVLLSPSFWRD